MRKPLSSETGNIPESVSGILAYRCSHGHIFMVIKNQQKANEKTVGK